MSIQEDEVFTDLFEKKKSKARSTDMRVTLNLNERFSSMTGEQKQQFKKFANFLFAEDQQGILDFFIDRTSPEDVHANIDKIEIKWLPEIGPKNGKLHLHALVSIEHHGFLSFQANELRSFAKDYFGHGIYLNCPISSSEKLKWANYIQKGLSTK